MSGGLGWLGIARLGLVQTSIGAIVVLMTSTINRVMIVELGLAAMLPGALIGLHYVVQLARPRFGHGSDMGGRRTPWIIAGMAVLAAGGTLAALSLYLFAASWWAGFLVATLAFVLVGAGVGASGTLLLVLLATTVAAERRAAAATLTWLMMIGGFIATTLVSSAYLDPFSLDRLVLVTASVAALALAVTAIAVTGIERRYSQPQAADTTATSRSPVDFRAALRDVITEQRTRHFAAFVFVSMLAYSGLDVLLEPFAGAVHDMTPGETTRLTGSYSQGLLGGMLLVAWLGSWRRTGRHRAMRACMLLGCIGSALGLGLLAASAGGTGRSAFTALVVVIGLTNGLFAVAAIGCMMGLMSQGRQGRDGVRMGVWGAAQAMAFGVGAILGGAIVDALRAAGVGIADSYATAFITLGLLYALAALLVARLDTGEPAAAADAPANPLHAAAALDIK